VRKIEIFPLDAAVLTLDSRVVQISTLLFILTVAKVEASSFGFRNMISSKKNLTGLG